MSQLGEERWPGQVEPHPSGGEPCGAGVAHGGPESAPQQGGPGRVPAADERAAGGSSGLDRDGAQAGTDRLSGVGAWHDGCVADSGGLRVPDAGEADQGVATEGTPVGAGGHREDVGRRGHGSRSSGAGIDERRRGSEPIPQGRRRLPGKNKDAYPFRSLSRSGRRACAPGRTRNGDDLGVLNGAAAERVLATAARTRSGHWDLEYPLPRPCSQNILELMKEVTRILSAIVQGESHAAEQLLPLVYDELRMLAVQRLAQEKPGQTLQ